MRAAVEIEPKEYYCYHVKVSQEKILLLTSVKLVIIEESNLVESLNSKWAVKKLIPLRRKFLFCFFFIFVIFEVHSGFSEKYLKYSKFFYPSFNAQLANFFEFQNQNLNFIK